MKHVIYTRDHTENREFTPALRAKIKKAVKETLRYEGFERLAELSVCAVDEEEIRTLNREYRQKDSVTDVLSFPMIENPLAELSPADLNPDSGAALLGDIVLCIPRCREQARRFGHSVERELCYLTIHSVLHLLGYDHSVRPEEEVMTRKQDEIIKKCEKN